jgi:hypothetical protein
MGSSLRRNQEPERVRRIYGGNGRLETSRKSDEYERQFENGDLSRV